MSMNFRKFRFTRHQEGGFTLIEVMIAVLVMGIGLLGFAMLQTMNVRFTKSAQERTVATSLAYELVDMMRSQRSQASYYNGVTYGSFAGITGNETNCVAGATATPAENITRWRCQLRRAFPDGDASVVLSVDGQVAVTVRWTDAFWNSPTEPKTEFTIRSRI